MHVGRSGIICCPGIKCLQESTVAAVTGPQQIQSSHQAMHLSLMFYVNKCQQNCFAEMKHDNYQTKRKPHP